MRALLVFLSLVALALCQTPPVQNIISIPGQGGNGVIFTQQTGLFSIPNVLNPVAVTISFDNVTQGETWSANVCLNSNQQGNPTPGNNFNACPAGGYVSDLTNNTASTGNAKLKFNRQSSSHKISQLLSKMVEQNVAGANAYTATTNGAETAGVTVVINGASASNASFTVYVTWLACEDPDLYPTPDGTDCQPATPLVLGGSTITINPNTTGYFFYETDDFDSTANNQLVLTYNGTQAVFVQKGYLPSADYNIAQPAGTITLNTPGYFSGGDKYFFSFQNTGANPLPIAINLNYTVCTQGLFGPGCAVNETVTNSTDGTTVTSLSATFSAETGGNNNNGAAWQLDLSDSDNTFAYFAIQNLPANFTTPYYVRVSVGNVDLEDDEDNVAPTIYAKKGGYPSIESNDITVGGSLSNQALLQVDDPATDEWFVAVQLPSNFAIWVGVNCAGNCSNGEHGSCVCSYANGTTIDCQQLVSNSTDYALLYTFPTNTAVSTGSCDCSDSDYDLSYDCSQKSSPTVLFIVLIVIGGLIILFVAIGVPLYCYISNKRKERYERI